MVFFYNFLKLPKTVCTSDSWPSKSTHSWHAIGLWSDRMPRGSDRTLVRSLSDQSPTWTLVRHGTITLIRIALARLVAIVTICLASSLILPLGRRGMCPWSITLSYVLKVFKIFHLLTKNAMRLGWDWLTIMGCSYGLRTSPFFI